MIELLVFVCKQPVSFGSPRIKCIYRINDLSIIIVIGPVVDPMTPLFHVVVCVSSYHGGEIISLSLFVHFLNNF